MPCTSISTANIGKNPPVPVTGTLYKLTADGVWTPYYTPYTYPHALRTDCANYPTVCDEDTVPPAVPSGLTVN